MRFYLLIGYCLLVTWGFSQGLGNAAENCKKYENNREWLPDAFVVNATCACEETPDELRANVIREVLQTRLDQVPPQLKQMAREQKQLLQNHTISRRKYNRFVKRWLTPVIYTDHLIAYQAANCKGNPAPYWAWKVVTTIPFRPCKIVRFFILCGGGSCSDCTCKW